MYKSEKFWNKLSKNYDEKAMDKTYEQILLRSKKYLESDNNILDFGCATGLYSFEFANDVKSIQAFDISSKMIDVAKSQAKKKGSDNIEFSQTTLFDEKYEKGSFDIILAFNILLYFKDAEKVLNRMNELLKSGGLIVTSTACLKERRTLVGTLSGGIIFLLKKLSILPYLKFLRITELTEYITKSKFNIIESDILIEKPATEFFIVARKNG